MCLSLKMYLPYTFLRNPPKCARKFKGLRSETQKSDKIRESTKRRDKGHAQDKIPKEIPRCQPKGPNSNQSTMEKIWRLPEESFEHKIKIKTHLMNYRCGWKY